jgi:hypothetical protein
MLNPAKHLARAARGIISNDAGEMLHCVQHDVLLGSFRANGLLAQPLGLG